MRSDGYTKQSERWDKELLHEYQSPDFFCFFLTGSSTSPFVALLTGVGFGFGFLGAGFSDSESTSIGSSASPLFDFDTGFATLAFLGFFFSPSSSSTSTSLLDDAAFFFFVGGASLSPFAFAFAAFFFGPFLSISRSPDASDAVAPPSESELESSVGEPESEEDAWKSSSVLQSFFTCLCVSGWGYHSFGREGGGCFTYRLRCRHRRRLSALHAVPHHRHWRRSASPRLSRHLLRRAVGRHQAPSHFSPALSCL